MKIVITALGLLGLVALVNSCGPVNDQTVRSQDPIVFNIPRSKDLKTALSEANFDCADPADCPKNVGMTYAISGTSLLGSQKVKQCSGFLIASDIVATNSHCIPDSLKIRGASCFDQIVIRLMPDGSGKTVFGCTEILSFSEVRKDEIRPDYAFFRIEDSGRQPIRISKAGIKNNEVLYNVKVTPSAYRDKSTLETQECKSVMGSFLNFYALSSWSRTGALVNCKAIEGNSGSPILNKDGLAVGILQSYLGQNYHAALNRLAGETFKLPSNQLPDHGQFTNLSCVTDPQTQTGENKNCKIDETLGMQDCIDFETAENKKAAKDISDNWVSQLPPILAYEIQVDPNGPSQTAVPVCVKKPSQYPDYKKIVTKTGTIGFRTEQLHLTFNPSLKFKVTALLAEDYSVLPNVEFKQGPASRSFLELKKDGRFWVGRERTENQPSLNQFLGLYIDSSRQISLKECSDEEALAETKVKYKIENGTYVAEAEYQRIEAAKPKRTCER